MGWEGGKRGEGVLQSKMTRCSECKRKMTLVETVVGPCVGCSSSFCVQHRASHMDSCALFHSVKSTQGKEALAARLRQEATKSSKGLVGQ